MALITTADFAKALKPGVKKWVGLAYESTPHLYKEMMQVEKSDKNFEEEVTAAGTGLLTQKSEGSNIMYDDMQQGFVSRYTHTVYASGFIITREAIEDNLYVELASRRSRALGESALNTKETVCANLFNRAFNSSYVGADGVEMCSAVHLLEKGGTYRNELATAADLSEASLEQACIDIKTQLKSGSGLLIKAMPKKLIIPAELAFTAHRLLASTLQNDTANNAINSIRAMNAIPEGMVSNPHLTDSDAWFLSTSISDGPKIFERRAMEVENDTDFDSENVKFKVTERYSVGWTDPRGIFGTPGAA